MGRRALVRLPGGEWRDAAGWEDFDHHDAYARMWGLHFACSAETALLPSQCPRCFEVDAHADGCMVAANLVKGVPEFWAPWAMWAFPPEEDGRALYVCIRDNVERLPALEDEGTWLFDGLPVAPGTTMEELGDAYGEQWLFALGPDGPTLAPWATP